MIRVAITGGKGGVGKSCVAASVAVAMAKKGHRTVLFDADLGLANVDILLGLKAEATLQHVVNEEKTLREALTPGPFGLRVACGGSGIGSLMNAGPKRLERFFSQLADLEKDTDFLIFDTGSGIDRRVMAFLRASDHVVVVATPDPSSLTDAYATIKTLNRYDKIVPVHILTNRVDYDIEGQQTFKTLKQVSQKFLKRDVDSLGSIPNDPGLTAAVRQRKPLLEVAPNSPSAKALGKVADKVARFQNARALAPDFFEAFSEAA